ncbi:VanW family protein [Clostridium sp. 19966]|uniref:VanW family protein n=1 Tax=Clostridium sp. 19966 TaxID=2768166 RepID=UPI0028DFB6F2|nr:VanW family protein [Clostridium sp. 19966]MDT8717810.1 VanW family protein [Clostridium sp. 19966]
MKKRNAIILIGGVCFIALAAGISIPAYKIYDKVKSFEGYIYPDVKIQNEDMSGRTVEEAKKILTDKYEDTIKNKKININVNSKAYSISYDQLEAKYDIDKIVDEAYQYGHDGSILDKYKLITKPQSKSFSLSFSYNNSSKVVDDLVNNIKKDVNKDPKNGSITKAGSGFQVTPDKDGYKLKDEELKKNIVSSISDSATQDTEIKANIDVVKANATKEKLQTVNTLIGTFSTNYGSISSPGRMTNIQLATKAINGTWLMPGDTFSFNNVVGERTAAKGYQSAPVDIGTKTAMGLGGGICQVSTTLYNAMLLSGVKPTVRVHHTIPSVYVPLGLDATVDWGNLDYQFKNTLAYPIYIEGISDNGTETFNIYSNSSLLSKNYKVVNQVAEDDKSNTSTVYLQTYQNGTMVSNTYLYKDVYPKNQQ